jgi:hypothetical protein
MGNQTRLWLVCVATRAAWVREHRENEGHDERYRLSRNRRRVASGDPLGASGNRPQTGNITTIWSR